MAALAPVVARPSAAGYRRREPEHSLLWNLVAAEAPGLREALARARPEGSGLPRYVDKEIDAFLECGLLSRGFARVLCRRCRTEHLVAFSCRGRGLCPSYTARRMGDTAAHLVDRVLPYAPYRQWVVTFSRRVRAALAADPKLAAAALSQVLRTIFAWQRRRARRLGVRPARARSNGAVTFIQRFNSALELSLHFHILIPDGVFVGDVKDPDARPRLCEIDEPTEEEVAALLDEILKRVTRLLQKRGRLDEDNELEAPHLRLALQPAPSAGAFVEDPLPRLCARKDGFSLHAGRAVHRNDRVGLEPLCRYGLRPPLAQGRLTRADDGTIRYQMKRRFSDGRHVLRFEPKSSSCVFAPWCPRRAFTWCAMPVSSPPTPEVASRSPAAACTIAGRRSRRSPPPPRRRRCRRRRRNRQIPQGPDDPLRPRRLEWAALLKRTFGLDVLECPKCHSRMELIATIEDRLVARKILAHLRLPFHPPPRPPPWQPQRSLPFDPPEDDPCIDPPSVLD